MQGLTSLQRCKSFPLTLEGQARDWNRKLSQGSVRTFDQLCRDFVEYFIGAVTTDGDMMESLMQGEKETLEKIS